MSRIALASFGTVLRQVAPWGVAIAVAAAVATMPGVVVAVPCGCAVGWLAWSNARLRRVITDAAYRIAVVGNKDAVSLPDGVTGVEQRIAALGHRMTPVHPISGLPVREALLAQMNADAAGILGAIAFTDYDRLTAFDPELGARMLAASTDRLRMMLPPDRFVAQVDRGSVGFWFAAVTPDVVRAELDAIAYALGQRIDIDGTSIEPQISVRLARFDIADGLDASAFLARTLAAFALPNTPVGATATPEASFTEHARDRYALEQDLRRAIARREMRLDFQPLIDAAAGRVCGAEALLRWHHPEHGAVSPARFVPIMEAMGLASEIGMWALNTAVREAREWAAQGLGQLRVAVNISGLQLERDDLPILIQRTLERHEIGAAALEIELTESVATSDTEHCRRIFERLRAMGVKLAVDDFGTGYSGFSSLRALAFDKIKIDREFVTDVDTRQDSQAICQSIIALGRGLNIRVLAEGVERRAEYEWLRRHGCHHFQGYYFCRPMPSDAFVALVRDSAKLSALLELSSGRHQIEERLRA